MFCDDLFIPNYTFNKHVLQKRKELYVLNKISDCHVSIFKKIVQTNFSIYMIIFCSYNSLSMSLIFLKDKNSETKKYNDIKRSKKMREILFLTARMADNELP